MHAAFTRPQIKSGEGPKKEGETDSSKRIRRRWLIRKGIFRIPRTPNPTRAILPYVYYLRPTSSLI